MIGLCWILMHQKMILTIQSMEKVDIMIRTSTQQRFYVFLQASDGSLHAVVNCCMTNDHKQDSILIERWKKEVQVKNNKYVPLLRIVTADCFAAPCFVVEDKHHGLPEDMGSNEKHLLNGVTLVKPIDEAWPAEFL